jgi:hypothetical protein
MSVTLTLIPPTKLAVIAGKAANVAGFLMNNLDLSTSYHSPPASVAVRSGSAEIRGSISMDTRSSRAAARL